MRDRSPGGRKRTPDKEQMKSYLARGLTMQQIADEWLKDSGEEVTRQR